MRSKNNRVSHVVLQNRAVFVTGSPISYLHKLFALPDPLDNLFVSQVLKGIKKNSPPKSSKIPISTSLLNSILANVKHFNLSIFDQLAFKAMCTLAFSAFLRPGEFTSSDNNLQLSNISLFKHCLIIFFEKFKHAKDSTTMSLKATYCIDCPVVNLCNYLLVRGNKPGPLFCHPSKKPYTRKEFSDMLTKAKHFLKIPGHITPHSFRVGATTLAASKGFSDQYICQLGRWDSNSFRDYIKLNCILI